MRGDLGVMIAEICLGICGGGFAALFATWKKVAKPWLCRKIAELAASKGTESLGVKLELGETDFRIAGTSSVDLLKLMVGNPEGFHSPHLLTLDMAGVSVNAKGLVSSGCGKTCSGPTEKAPMIVEISDLHVKDLVLFYEQHYTSNNISAFIDQLVAEQSDGQGTAEAQAATSEAPDAAPAGRLEAAPRQRVQVILRRLKVEGLTAVISTDWMQRISVPSLRIELPTIEVEDFDSSRGGGRDMDRLLLDLVNYVLGGALNYIGDAASSAVTSGGGIVGNSWEAAGNLATGLADTTADAGAAARGYLGNTWPPDSNVSSPVLDRLLDSMMKCCTSSSRRQP